jgi:hypothetical protein
MKQQFKVYFKTRSNYVDLLSEILNLICFCCYKSQNLWLRLLGIIPIALMWYRFVVVLRNADSASAFITMLFAIIIESVPFIGILFVFYAAFTSVFLVLSIQANYFNNNLDISNSIFGIKYIDVMFNVI